MRHRKRGIGHGDLRLSQNERAVGGGVQASHPPAQPDRGPDPGHPGLSPCVAQDSRAGKDETIDELLVTLRKLMK